MRISRQRKDGRSPSGKAIFAFIGVFSCAGLIAARYLALQDIVSLDFVEFDTSSQSSRRLAAHKDGWSSIDVFIGDPDFLEPHSSFKYDLYSQSGQDQLVLKLLENKTDGYFIDLAANDPMEFSNTARLEKQNRWMGLCIEPNPAYWYRLAHRKCQIVGALVGKTMKQQVEVRFDNDVNGGIVGFDNKDGGKQKKRKSRLKKRYTATAISIFERFDVPKVIDYLSLDVEGAEYWVMEDFPFDKYMFKVMTVERPQEELQDLLKRNGYKLIKILTGFGETLWVHESLMGNKATMEVADLNDACWDYANRRRCQPVKQAVKQSPKK